MQKQIIVDCPSGVISKEAARSIARDIIEFFRDPDNMKGFEEWKKLNSTSWGKINKKMDGTGVMKPGKTKKKNPEVQ